MLYHLFTTDDGLLHHALFGAPLGADWFDALHTGGVAGPHGLVYLGLFAVIATVAGWTALRTRRAASTSGATAAPGMAAVTRLLPWLSFGSVVTAAVMPLAAGLYVATTTTWTAAERAWLRPERPLRVPPSAPLPVPHRERPVAPRNALLEDRTTDPMAVPIVPRPRTGEPR